MSRRGELSPEDRRIWARVAGSVKARSRPAPLHSGQADPPMPTPVKPASGKIPPKPAPKRSTAAPAAAAPPARPVAPRAVPAADLLEPRRQRRLARERDPIEARFDLHGFGRFEAEDQLVQFLSISQARGLRAVLVITGQGRLGGGVIRASIVEWLQGARLRPVVAGWSTAHRRHGGEGAFYITLRRR
jgi:DNA-nicking Smr family endonuclease